MFRRDIFGGGARAERREAPTPVETIAIPKFFCARRAAAGSG